ncbi:zinc finger protein 665-like [Anopheles aquasalis]|nr:zinc finger protein 665-like [Anopheles aquasalis]
MFSTKESSVFKENSSSQPPRQPRKRGRPRQETLKHDATRFTCRICNYELVDTIGLERHQQKHEPPGGFLCSVCKAPFTSPQARNEHKSQAHPVYRCRLCKESFLDEAQFQAHHKTVHVEPTEGSNGGTLSCRSCGTHFRTTFQLRVHLESKCGTKKHFQCDICQRYYSSQASLGVHRGLHQAKKSHLCDTCGASFYNRGQLKVHERVHTGDKPFKCNKCGKAFSHRESLVTHSSLHSGIKPYVCTHCNDQFSCKGNLIKHLQRRPLTCGRKEQEVKTVSDDPSSAEGVVEEAKPLPIVKSGKRVLISRTKLDDENDGDTEHFEVQEVSGSESEDTGHLLASEEKMEIIPAGEHITLLEVDLNAQGQSAVDQNEMEVTVPSWKMENEDAIPTMKHSVNKQHLPGAGVEDEIEMLEPSGISLTEECGKSSLGRASDGEDSYLCVIVNNGHEITGDDAEQHHWYTIVASETETRVEPCLPVKEDKINNQQTTTLNVPATKEALVGPPPTDYERKELENESTSSSSGDESLWFEENVSNANGRSARKSKKSTNPELVRNIKSNLKDEIPTKETSTESSKKPSRAELSQDEIDEMTISLEVEEVEKQLQTLKENYKIVSGADYQCNLCPVQHTSEYLIARHLERMHGIQLTAIEMLHLIKKPPWPDILYRCKYCGRMYSNPARLKVHVRHHGPHGTLLHKCTCCSRYFETAEDSRQHALATHRDRLVCNICQKQFQDPDCLQGHIRYAHRGVKEKRRLNFVCLRCGKRFTSRSVLTDHERSDCGDSPIYKCETCGKHYSSYGAWKVHKELHKDQLQFMCSYCMKRFRTKGQLKIHERSHTGEKPFRCEYCPKAFPYRESLMTHHAIHTGNKRFKCADCSQAFTCASNLKSHRRTHHPS